MKRTISKKIILIALGVIILLSAVAFVVLFHLPEQEDKQGTVEQPPAVYFQEDTVTIEKYETYKLEIYGAAGKTIEWKSENEKIATVRDGEVWGWQKGSTQILAYVDGLTLSCNVVVLDNQYIPVIELKDREEISLDLGSIYSLKPVLTYNGKTYTDVEYTYSSAGNAVTVNETGVITAAELGEAFVVVTGTWRTNVVETTLTVNVVDVSTSVEVSNEEFDIYLNSQDEEFPSSVDIGVSIFDNDVPIQEDAASVNYIEIVKDGDTEGAATVKNGVAYAEKVGTTHFVVEYTSQEGVVVSSAEFAINVHPSPSDTYMRPIEGEEFEFFIVPMNPINSVKWDEQLGAFHLENLNAAEDDGRAFVFSKDYIENIIRYTGAKSIVFEVKSDGVSSGSLAMDQLIYQSFYPDWYDSGSYLRIDNTDEWTKVEIFFDKIPLDENGKRKSIMLLSTKEGMYIRNIRPMTEGSFLTMDVEITTLGGNWYQDIEVGAFPLSYEGSINGYTNRVTVKAGVKTTVKYRLDDFLEGGKVPGFGIVIFGGPEWNTQLADGTYDRHTVKISNLRVSGETNYSLDLGTASWKTGKDGTGFTDANGAGVPYVEDGVLVIANGFRYDGHKITLGGAADNAKTHICIDMEITTLADSTEPVDVGFYPYNFEGDINDHTQKITVVAGKKNTVKLNLDDYLIDGKLPGIGFAIFGGPEWNTQLPDGTYDRHKITITGIRLEGEQSAVYDLNASEWTGGANSGYTNANSAGIASIADGTIVISNGYRYDGHKITLEREDNKEKNYICLDVLLTTLGNSTDPVEIRFYPHNFAGNVHTEYTDEVAVTAGTQTTVKLELDEYLVDGELPGIGFAVFGGPAWDTQISPGVYDRHSVTISNMRLEGETEQTVDLNNATVAAGFGGSNSGGIASIVDGTVSVTGGYRYDGHMITFAAETEPDVTEPEETEPDVTEPEETEPDTYICMDIRIDTVGGNWTDDIEVGFFSYDFEGDINNWKEKATVTAGEQTTVTLKLEDYLVDGELPGIGVVIYGGPEWNTQLSPGVYDRHTLTISGIRLEGAQSESFDLSASTVASGQSGTGYTNANGSGVPSVVNGTIVISNGYRYDGHKITFGTTQPQEPSDKLTVTGPTGTVYPYQDRVKEYLQDENIDIMSHYAAGTAENGDASLAPVRITWNDTSDSGVTKYVVEYGTSEDYSDAVTVVKDTKLTERSIDVYNLYKASTYYVRVTAYAGDTVLDQAEATFRTTDLGPRFMKIDGLYNVRDLGGYTTADGKTTVQGLIFRGSEMDGGNGIALTEAGNEYMSNVLGIRTDLDLRGYTTSSPISSATKKAIGISAYTDAFTQTELYREIFSILSDENNYPVYIHCMGGADRTGTVCYLLNALLGVSEEDLIRDYEMTSYSIFGERTKDTTLYQFPEFVEQLKAYPGDTLAEKTENYMLSIGVTETEIYNIRAIMLGEETKTEEDTASICLDMLITTLSNSTDPIHIRFYPYNYEGSVHTAYTDLITVTAGEQTTVKLDLSKYLIDGELPGIGFAIFGGPEWNTQISPGVYDRHTVTISGIYLEGEASTVYDLSKSSWTSGTNGTGYTDANGSGAASVADGSIVITNGFRYDGHKLTLVAAEQDAPAETFISMDILITTLSNSTDPVDVRFYPYGFDGNVHTTYTDKVSVTAGTKTTVKLNIDDYLVDGEFPGIGIAIFGGPEWNTQISPGVYDRHTVTVSNMRLEGGSVQTIDLSEATVSTGFGGSNSGGTASIVDGTIVMANGFCYDGHMITFGSTQQLQKKSHVAKPCIWLLPENGWKKAINETAE